MTLYRAQVLFERCIKDLKQWRNISTPLSRMVDILGRDREADDVYVEDVRAFIKKRRRQLNSLGPWAGKYPTLETLHREIKMGRTFYNFMAKYGIVQDFVNPFKEYQLGIQDKLPMLVFDK